MLELIKFFASPILKLFQFLYNHYSLSNEIENTKKEIEYLNLINDKQKNINESLVDLIYRRKYGITYKKYQFFKNNSKIEDEIEDSQYKSLSLFTYKVKKNFIVKMKLGDKLLYYAYTIFGIILLVSSLVILITTFILNTINFSDILVNVKYQKSLLVMVVFYILGLVCLITYLKPILIFSKYKRLNR